MGSCFIIVHDTDGASRLINDIIYSSNFNMYITGNRLHTHSEKGNLLLPFVQRSELISEI